MRFTFKPDDCMVITIPLGSIRNAGEGQLMPDKFTCRFKDSYKVFQRGCPKALGVAQIITAVFILCLGGILLSWEFRMFILEFCLAYVIPCILYIICGTLAIGAGHTPLMPMMKASFVFNIIGLFLAVIMISICGIIISICRYDSKSYPETMCVGLKVVTMVLYAFQFVLSVVLIHWESKALCRAHFNSLPMITLKQEL